MAERNQDGHNPFAKQGPVPDVSDTHNSALFEQLYKHWPNNVPVEECRKIWQEQEQDKTCTSVENLITSTINIITDIQKQLEGNDKSECFLVALNTSNCPSLDEWKVKGIPRSLCQRIGYIFQTPVCLPLQLDNNCIEIRFDDGDDCGNDDDAFPPLEPIEPDLNWVSPDGENFDSDAFFDEEIRKLG
jgi:hypothetical protein